MSHDSFQIAFERATNEIAEIDALLEKLSRRRELLAKVVGPLQGLVAAGASPIAFGESIEPDSFGAGLHEEGEEGHAFGFAQHQGAAEEVDPYANGAGHAAETPQTDVATLAYRLWIERGGTHGQHEEDWIRAEEELNGAGR